MTEVKILKQFQIVKPLNDTYPSSWDKIEIANGWGEFTKAFRQNNSLLFRGNSFISLDARNDFNQFINGSVGNTVNDKWDDIIIWFKNAQKLFPGNHDRLASPQAYEFLKKYIGNYPFNIRYSPGYTFPKEEFKPDFLISGENEILSQEKDKQIALLIQQKEQIEKDCDIIKNNLAMEHQNYQQTKTENEQLKNNLAVLQQEKTNLEASKQTLNTQLEQIKKDKTSVEQARDNLQKENEALKAQIKHLHQVIGIEESEINEQLQTLTVQNTNPPKGN